MFRIVPLSVSLSLDVARTHTHTHTHTHRHTHTHTHHIHEQNNVSPFVSNALLGRRWYPWSANKIFVWRYHSMAQTLLLHSGIGQFSLIMYTALWHLGQLWVFPHDPNSVVGGQFKETTCSVRNRPLTMHACLTDTQNDCPITC